jgi:predicted TIM-barrel fold metal-dependent hydrolase
LIHTRHLAIAECCRALPEQPFVLDHLGRASAVWREPWAHDLRRLAAHGRCLQVSGW